MKIQTRDMLSFILISVAIGIGYAISPVVAAYCVLISVMGMTILYSPYKGLYLLLLITPVHLLLMIILYGVVGLSVSQVYLFASWKEVAIVILLIYAVLSAMLHLELMKPPKIYFVDICVALYIGLNLLYFFFIDSQTGMVAKMYGLREGILPGIVYFVFRLIPFNPKQVWTTFKLILVLGMVAGIIAIAERLISPVNLLISIGYREYFMDVISVPQVLNKDLLLAHNYWSYTSLGPLRRVGSIFVHPLVFGISSILIVVVGAYYAAFRKKSVLYLVIPLIALFFTLSRGPIIASLIGISVLITIRKKGHSRGILYLGIILLLLLFVLSPAVMAFLHDTLKFKDTSVISRIGALNRGLNFIMENPLGGRLTTAFARFQTMGGYESQYLETASQVGVLGVFLLLVMTLTPALKGLRFLQVCKNEYERSLLTICAASGVAFFFFGFINSIWNNPFVLVGYWWLAGATMQSIARMETAMSVKESTIKLRDPATPDSKI